MDDNINSLFVKEKSLATLKNLSWKNRMIKDLNPKISGFDKLMIKMKRK
jgi:hypothetical protein